MALSVREEVNKGQRGSLPKKDKGPTSLRLWVFKFTENAFGVCVEGYRSMDTTQTNLMNWISTPIESRETSSTLISTTGSIYKLLGPIDEGTAQVYGYPKSLIALFKTGFPPDWESLLKEYYKVVKRTNPLNASHWFDHSIAARRKSIVAGRGNTDNSFQSVQENSVGGKKVNRRTSRLSTAFAGIPDAIEEEKDESHKENSHITPAREAAKKVLELAVIPSSTPLRRSPRLSLGAPPVQEKPVDSTPKSNGKGRSKSNNSTPVTAAPRTRSSQQNTPAANPSANSTIAKSTPVMLAIEGAPGSTTPGSSTRRRTRANQEVVAQNEKPTPASSTHRTARANVGSKVQQVDTTPVLPKPVSRSASRSAGKLKEKSDVLKTPPSAHSTPKNKRASAAGPDNSGAGGTASDTVSEGGQQLSAANKSNSSADSGLGLIDQQEPCGSKQFQAPSAFNDFRVPDMSHIQRVTPAQSKKIAQLKKSAKVLYDWCINFVAHNSRFPAMSHPPFVLVGKNPASNSSDDWLSTVVTEMVNSRLFITLSGGAYRLEGPINHMEAARKCFPKDFVRKFHNGFPMSWREDLMNLYDTVCPRSSSRAVVVAKPRPNRRSLKETCEPHVSYPASDDGSTQNELDSRARVSGIHATPDQAIWGEDQSISRRRSKDAGRSKHDDSSRRDGQACRMVVPVEKRRDAGEVRLSSRGRVQREPLAYWANQRVRYSTHGDAIGVEDVSTRTMYCNQTADMNAFASHYGVSPAHQRSSQKDKDYGRVPHLAVEYDGRQRVNKKRALVTYSDSSSSSDESDAFVRTLRQVADDGYEDSPLLIKKKGHYRKLPRIESDDDSDGVRAAEEMRLRMIRKEKKKIRKRQKMLEEMEQMAMMAARKAAKRKQQRRQARQRDDEFEISQEKERRRRERERDSTETEVDSDDGDWRRAKKTAAKKAAVPKKRSKATAAPRPRVKKEKTRVATPPPESSSEESESEEQEEEDDNDANFVMEEAQPLKKRTWKRTDLDRLKLAINAKGVYNDDDWEKISRSLGEVWSPEECKQTAIRRLKWVQPSEDPCEPKEPVVEVTARKGTAAYEVQAHKYTRQHMMGGSSQDDDFFRGRDNEGEDPFESFAMPDVTNLDSNDSLIEVLRTPVLVKVPPRVGPNRRAFVPQELEDTPLALRKARYGGGSDSDEEREELNQEPNEQHHRYLHHLLHNKGHLNNTSRMGTSMMTNYNAGGRNRTVMDISRQVEDIQKKTRKGTGRKDSDLSSLEDEDEQDY